MQNAYGLYKKVRNSAWQILIDNKISALPVDVVAIAVQNGITILKNSDAQELQGGESGVGIYDGESWFIVYDDAAGSLGRARFTIAHELGHIFLGHPLIAGYHRRTAGGNKPQVESEADMFAARLLCPACVLWGLNLRSADEIARACQISKESAVLRATRMKELYVRGKFLTSPVEKQLFDQFKGFIEANAPPK